jgi:hypothetical protein
MTEYRHHEAIRLHTILAARRQLAALTPDKVEFPELKGKQTRDIAAQTDRRQRPPTGKRMGWRAFAAESAAAERQGRPTENSQNFGELKKGRTDDFVALRTHPPRDDISAAETILFKEAKVRLGVGMGTLLWWIRIGRLQTVEVAGRRLIVAPQSVRIIAAEQHRLPELHRLIDEIGPQYPEETIAGLVAIIAAAERRLGV